MQKELVASSFCIRPSWLKNFHKLIGIRGAEKFIFNQFLVRNNTIKNKSGQARRKHAFLCLLFWCIYCTKLEPISKTNDVPRAERVVAWNWIVRSYRSATASQSLGNPKEKCLLLFWFGEGEFFFESGKDIFLWGSAFQIFRQVAEQCGRSFGKTIFWGEKDLPKLRLIYFWIRKSQAEEEGFGEESARASFFGGWRGKVL